MTILEIADEIFRENGSPTDLSVAFIGFWLRGHIGDLNAYTREVYSVGTSNNSLITPNPDDFAKSIYKKLFNIYWYGRKIVENLGAASQSILMEVSSDGAAVRTVNKNEIAKTFIALLKEEKDSLSSLLRERNISISLPLQVVGDDTIGADGREYIYSR